MKIISNVTKLIFRPQANTPNVDFPTGTIMSEYGADNETPTVIVQNATAKGKPWQGVSYEIGSIIVNGVPKNVAEMALKQYTEAGQTIESLKQILTNLANEGYDDQYTTNLDFIKNKLSPDGIMLDRYTGIVKRNEQDQVECWREGDVYFVSPNNEPRVIEDFILIRDYRLPDGSAIDLNQVPEGRDPQN